MDILKIGSRILTFALQYPLERHLKIDRNKSDKVYEELKTSMSSPIEIKTPAISPPEKITESEIDEIIKREQQGDYCVSCVPSKHLMRAKDALTDAFNIVQSKGEFTDVVEGKLQTAVYELNGAEVDLEKAKIPSVIKPATDELHNQIRKLRNFLRQDQSGLELATTFPERQEEMKGNLELARDVSDVLIQHGYDIAKVQLRARKEEAEAKYDSQS